MFLGITGVILFFLLIYVANELQTACNNIKIIRQELEELKRDVEEYIQFTEPRIDETNLNVWDLNEVRIKRERQQNASFLDYDPYNDR